MKPCSIKRGIFSLRECGNEASDACTSCHKPLCQEHLIYSEQKVYCANCQNAPDKIGSTLVDQPKAPESDPEWNRPGWSQRWRSNYYADSHYLPFMYGGWNAGYYDASDRSGFESRSDAAFDNDDNQSAGFSDS